MEYQTVKEFAEKWRLSVRCVQNYCINEKIPGARYIGKQWMIPSDSVLPPDGRTRTGREKPAKYRYRFPLPVYSGCYSDRSELSEEEQKLLKAQELHFEGRYSEGIAICSSLLGRSLPRYILIAAHFTIGFNAALLGLHLEYKKSVLEMEELIEGESDHREDMELLLATLKYHTAWDFEHIKRINPEALSEDAMLLYKYNLLTKNILSGSIEDEMTYRYVQSDLVRLKARGIMPLALVYHCLLGSGNYSMTHSELCEYHFGEAARIAVEQGWLAKLSKFYPFNAGVIERSVLKYGKVYLDRFKEMREKTTKNWQITHYLETGRRFEPDITDERAEYLLLLTYNLSYEQIAVIKQLSTAEVKAVYKELFGVFKVKSKRELVEFAFNFFESFKPQA